MRGDKAFMMQAIALNPNTFYTLPPEIMGSDFNLFLRAFGGTAGQYPYLTPSTARHLREAITTFAPMVEVAIEKYELFVETFLCGMTDPESSLTLLNQGVTTSANYKRLIAAYHNVRKGDRLRMLRKASRNLSFVLAGLVHFL